MLTHGLSSRTRRAGICRAATLFLVASATAATASAQDPDVFLDQNGLVVIEFESAVPTDQWTLSTATPGFLADGYFRWDGPNLFNSPGQAGVFSFDFEVQTAGNYRMSIRNRHENPDATEENDVWVRMDGGQWIKVFSNMPGSVGAWTWESRFDFGHGNPQPDANYDLTAGIHTIEFSGRSFGFKMDRVHLFLPGTPGANDPNQPESPRRFGTPYCDANPNSSGSVSTVYAYGSPYLADDSVILGCSDLPQNALGYYITSRAEAFVANPGGSDGNLCVGANTGRYAGNVLNSGSAGFASLRIDLSSIPQPTGSVAAQVGETWNFQLWHRDAGSGGPTSNFSRGLRLTFR